MPNIELRTCSGNFFLDAASLIVFGGWFDRFCTMIGGDQLRISELVEEQERWVGAKYSQPQTTTTKARLAKGR